MTHNLAITEWQYLNKNHVEKFFNLLFRRRTNEKTVEHPPRHADRDR